MVTRSDAFVNTPARYPFTRESQPPFWPPVGMVELADAVLVPLRAGSKLPNIRGASPREGEPESFAGGCVYPQPAPDDPCWAGGVGVLLGHSGLIVVDIDTGADGPEVAAELARRGLPAEPGPAWKEVAAELKRVNVPARVADRIAAVEAGIGASLAGTFTVATPSGGRHFYFRVPEDAPVLRAFMNPLGAPDAAGDRPIVRGVDVKTGAGYVCAPPTPGYAVIDAAPITIAPAGLVEQMIYVPRPLRPRREGLPTGDAAEVAELLGLIDLAAQPLPYEDWRDCVSAVKGLLGDDGYGVARDWSSRHHKGDHGFDATWDGMHGGHGIGTVIRVAQGRASKAAVDAVRDRHGRPFGKALALPPRRVLTLAQVEGEFGAKAATVGEEMAAHHAARELMRIVAAQGPEAAEAKALLTAAVPEPERGGGRMLVLADPFAEDEEEPEAVIADWIGAGDMALLFGASNAGKTFVAIDMAQSVATGTPYHGHAVKAGPVIYLAGEGGRGFKRRLAAWRIARGIDRGTHVPFYVLGPGEGIVHLAEAASVDRWVAEIGALRAELERGGQGAPVMLVVDTLATATPGVEENSAKDMGQVVEALRRLRAACRPDAAILSVHHTGKDGAKGERGSSALRAAVDVSLKVERPDGEPGSLDARAVVTLEATKVRDAAFPIPIRFGFEQVDTGDGKTVPVPISRAGAGDPAEKLGKDQTARDFWAAFVAEDAENAGRGADASALRERLAAGAWSEKSANAQSQAFGRAKRACERAGLIVQDGDGFRRHPGAEPAPPFGKALVLTSGEG